MARRRKTIDLDDLLTETGRDAADMRACAHPDCGLPGDFRAPRSREDVRDYIWFCLEHVRSYNNTWNYYDGMSEAEIEADRRGAAFWHRPTWPLNGRRPGADTRDGFGIFGDGPAGAARCGAHDPLHAEALAVMNLSPPLTTDAIKRRYKELVKRHHPDANGGDKLAEEHLKTINQAYATLMESVGP